MLEFNIHIFLNALMANFKKLSFVLPNNNKVLYIIAYKSSIFALTVLATLPIGTASQGESFAFIDFTVIDNVPSKPLFQTFLEGFCFCRKIISYDL